MELKELYPVWKELTPRQQALLEQNTVRRRARRGERMHTGAEGCEGLYIVTEGVLRVSTLSEEGGREITLYRLYERDICLFTASCVLSGLQFEPQVQAQTDAEVLVVSAPAYKALMRESLPAAAYTNRLMASRFSEVMARLEQILHGRLDARLAAALLEEAQVQQADRLSLTHEQLAGSIGSAREAVTRMLHEFQSRGLVRLSRGEVQLTGTEGLRELAGPGW